MHTIFVCFVFDNVLMNTGQITLMLRRWSEKSALNRLAVVPEVVYHTASANSLYGWAMASG